MKKILSVLCVLSIMSCTSIAKTVSNSERNYSKILEFNSISKNELFVKSMNWIAESFKSAKSVIDFSDKDAGNIIGHIVLYVNNGVGIKVPCEIRMQVEIKDAKARISFSNYTLKDGYGRNVEFMNLAEFEDTQRQLEILTNELNAYILAKQNW